MFAHYKLLRTFVFLFAAAAIVFGNAIPSPNAHRAAIQADEHKNPPVVLESRAPKVANLPLFDQEELGSIYGLCLEITRRYRRNDYWFFVGNSGGYLAYCFDHPRFKPIPISGARRYARYRHREDDPEGRGRLRNGNRDLRKYYDEIIAPKVGNLQIDRIMLVDHSSTGQSVEATKLLLMDMFKAKGPAVENRFRNVQWGLFNAVDGSKVPVGGGPMAVTCPKGFDPCILVSTGSAGHVNKLLGDKTKHNRCQADYWPSLWYKSVGEIWESRGGKPQAMRIRQQIKDEVKAQTGDGR